MKAYAAISLVYFKNSILTLLFSHQDVPYPLQDCGGTLFRE